MLAAAGIFHKRKMEKTAAKIIAKTAKRGRKLNSESLRVLRLMLHSGAVSIQEFTQAHFKGEMPWDHRSVFLKLHDLHRGGYVRKSERKNQSFFHLTPKGKLQVLKYLHLEKLLTGKWDGRWRVIMFDLPESTKKWREHMRGEIKALGFYALQESVYITPHPVTGELDKYIKKWNLRKYFRYLTVSEIDGEEFLKKVFGVQ